MTAKKRTVLVGCGGISRAWMNPVKEFADVEMVGFVDIRQESAEALAKEFSLTCPTGTDLEEMIRKTGAEVVFDCTIPEIHHDVAMIALNQGCHLLCEKPMADSMDRAKAMVRLANEKNLTFAVIQNRRYNNEAQTFRQQLQNQSIGNIHTLHSDFFIGAHFGGFRDQMKHVLLLDMSIHTFDMARFLSNATPMKVWARDWNPQGSWYDHGASAVAFFTMENGLVYTYRGSWCAEGLNTSWECEWRGIGTQGTAMWDGKNEIKAQHANYEKGFSAECTDASIVQGAQLKHLSHAGVIRNFLDCLDNGEIPQTAGADNIKSLAMVHGAIASSVAGREVDIDLSL